jgi:hypothetical protein
MGTGVFVADRHDLSVGRVSTTCIARFPAVKKNSLDRPRMTAALALTV